jgi:hypothetical protein
MLGVFRGSDLVAAVALHNWDQAAGVIEVSGASIDKRWLTRPTLWEIYNRVFNLIGCQLVVQRNDPDAPINRMCLSYGFNGYRIPRLRGRDRDEIVMTLTAEDWRANGFHKENTHGQH